MTKPPATPPHSDIDGVHRHARATPRAAAPEANKSKAGRGAEDIDRAEKGSRGRPRRSQEESRDDRSG